MNVYLDQNNIAFNFSQNVYIDNVHKWDYFEIYWKTLSNESLVLQNLNWYVDSR